MQRRPSTQDISWFLDLASNNQLELNPPYQRRSVWTNKDRRFFLDTIFKGYPCPAIFLHKRIDDGRSIYDVVDGKQRLETILRFTQNKIAIDSNFSDARVAGKKWRDLGEAEKKQFWNYVLPVEQLDFEGGETAAVEDAFDRLNRNSRKLEPQELRHARFDGWFISTVENECQDPFWKSVGIVTGARAKRMKDAQFIAELLLVVIENRISGFDQDQLDAAHAKYDDPDDEGTSLDTEDVGNRFSTAKQFLGEVNAINGCVKYAGATVGAFYTLWALIVLHRNDLPPAGEFAIKYSAFVDLANRLRQASANFQTELDLNTQEQSWRAVAQRYDQALQGAHTDFAQRDERLKAALEALRRA